MIKIPIHKYIPNKYTRDLLLEVYDSGNLVQGKMVERFEEACKKMSGAKYAAATSNGTTALTLMFDAQVTSKSPLAVTNPLSFIATKNALQHGAMDVVFFDVDYETGMLDEKSLENYVLDHRADNALFVVPVDLHGVRDPLDSSKYPLNHLTVLRDSSQSHGQKIQETDTALSFSFHASKNATSGEGGVVVSNDENLIEEIKLLRNHGMNSNREIVRDNAYNARMTDIQAAIGIGSLTRLEDANYKRRENANFYDENLEERFIEDVVDPQLRLPAKQEIYHHYVLRHPKAEKIVTILRYLGIDARRYYDKLISPPGQYLPNAQAICDESFCIPVHEHLTREERDYVYENLFNAIRSVQYD